MASSSKVLKSGVWYIFSNIIVKGIGVLTTPIFARLLSKADYGYYGNFTSWLNIALILMSLNVGVTMISAKYDYEERLDQYVLSSLALSTTSVIIWIIALTLFPDFFVQITGVEIRYLFALCIYVLFYSAVDVFQVKERYAYKYKTNIAVSILVAVSTALLSVILVVSLDNKIDARIFGQLLPTVVIGIVIYILIIFRGRKVDFKSWKYTLAICLPFIPHLLSLTILNSTDQVMITKICGTENNALYSVAYTSGMMISMFTSALNGAYSPWLGEQLHDENYSRIKDISKVYILSFCLFSVGVMLISPIILYVLGGRGYIEARFVMPPVTMGCVCQFVYTMFASVEQYKKKTKGMAAASVSAAIFNIALNALCIPVFGYIAAAFTTLISYLELMVVHMFLVKRIGYAQAFDYMLIIRTILIMLLVMLCVFFAYYNYLFLIGIGMIYTVFLSILTRKQKDRLLYVIRAIRKK